MRFIKPLLIGFAGLFTMITLLSLLIPSKIKVSRATVINAPADKIQSQIANLRNWENWHPMFQRAEAIVAFPNDSSNQSCDIIYNNKIAHVQIISVDSSSVKFTLTSAGENEIDNELFIIPVKEHGLTEVQWHALTLLHWYPWDKFYGIFIDQLTGIGYETALEELKKFTENN